MNEEIFNHEVCFAPSIEGILYACEKLFSVLSRYLSLFTFLICIHACCNGCVICIIQLLTVCRGLFTAFGFCFGLLSEFLLICCAPTLLIRFFFLVFCLAIWSNTVVFLFFFFVFCVCCVSLCHLDHYFPFALPLQSDTAGFHTFFLSDL